MTIPGDILEDDSVSDGAKIIYGKIARLSYKTGYCWASNEFLAGEKSAATAKRQIKELIDAGYLRSQIENCNMRKLFICEVDSRVGKGPQVKNDPDQKCTTPGSKMHHPQVKNDPPPQVKNDPQTLQDKTDLKNKEKETGSSIPDDEPIKTKEDGAAVFQKARLFWNEKGLKPECRDIMMRCTDTSDILRTFQHYTWEEMRNAIGNYHWHKRAGPGYLDPPPYGSLAGFLKTGVDRYFDDDALDQQFKKEGK